MTEPLGWRFGAKVALVVVALAMGGEAGHQVLARMGAGAASVHHAFHLVYPGAAAVVFCIYLAEFIRREGWPVFSWRLRPAPLAQPPEVADGGRRRGAGDHGHRQGRTERDQ